MKREEALKVAKPILFNTEMVRAILDGRKVITRRVAKILLGVGECDHGGEHEFILDNFAGREIPTGFVCRKCGRGVSPPHSRRSVGNSWIVPPCFPGDILYVRETWCRFDCEHCDGDILTGEPLKDDCLDETIGGCWMYRASNIIGGDARWRPSIHMPKEAARIFLRVRSVYAELLQDINGYGVLAEGVDNGRSNPIMGERWENMQRMAYSDLWNSTVKKSDLDKYGWNANPWVWVIEFERLEVTE